MIKKTRKKMLSYPVRNYTDCEIKKFLKLDRKETKELKAKGLKILTPGELIKVLK